MHPHTKEHNLEPYPEIGLLVNKHTRSITAIEMGANDEQLDVKGAVEAVEAVWMRVPDRFSGFSKGQFHSRSNSRRVRSRSRRRGSACKWVG